MNKASPSPSPSPPANDTDDSAHSKKRKLEANTKTTSKTNDHGHAQHIQQLLEGLSREQLVQVLTTAATQHDDVYQDIAALARSDVTHRKVFVRGLAWATTSDRLSEVFARFGTVEEGAVIYDKSSGKSRGFGFVTFVDIDAAQRAIAQRSMEIDGRMTSCNLASVRAPSDDQHASSAKSAHHNSHSANAQPPSGPPVSPAYTFYPAPMQPTPYVYAPEYATLPPPTVQPAYDTAMQAQDTVNEADRKLFVRGLAWETTDDTLRSEFIQFGELVEAAVVRDRKNGKSKGFGFVTFRRRDSALQALQAPQKIIDGRTTTCNLASQGGRRSNAQASTQSSQPATNPAAPPPMQVSGYPGMPVAYASAMQPMAQPPLPAGAAAYPVYAVPPTGPYPQQYAYAAPTSSSYMQPPAPPQQ